MKEYKVGEFFTIGKDTYKVVYSVDGVGSCNCCEFLRGEHIRLCESMFCYGCTREDSNEVIFILYDQEVEDDLMQ